jgi:hypothetical protein
MNSAAKTRYDRCMPHIPWYKAHPVLKLYEPKQYRLEAHHFFHPLRIPLAIAFSFTLIAVGWFVYAHFHGATQEVEEFPIIAQSPTATPAKPSVTPSPYPTTPPPKTVYSLSLRPLNSDFTPPTTPFITFLSQALSERFPSLRYTGPYIEVHSQPKTTESGIDWYNQDYVILKISGGLTVPALVEYEGVKLTLNAAPESLKPYLTGNRFCQTDKDCLLRESLCVFGAYNAYEQVRDAYQCSGGKMTQDNLAFGSYNSRYQCITDVIYASLECRGNQCQALEPSLVCQPE